MTRIRCTSLMLLLWVAGTGIVSASVTTSDLFTDPAVIPPLPDDDTSIPCDLTAPTSCERDQYCVDLDETEAENNGAADPTTGVCLHKTLQTLSLTDVLGLGLIFGACWMAAMAGIGGGGLLFPILTLIMNFDAKQGAVLGNAGVLGNASGQVLWNHVLASKQRTFEATNTVFEIAILILPTLVAGGSWALVLVGLVPSTVLLLLAVVTLTFATTKTYFKANQMRQKERREHQQPSPPPTAIHDETGNADDEQMQQGANGDNPNRDAGSTRVPESAPEEAPVRSAYEEALLDMMSSSPETDDDNRTCSASLATKCWIVFFWLVSTVTFFAEHFVAMCSPLFFFLLSIPTISAVLFLGWRWRHQLFTHSGEARSDAVRRAEATSNTNSVDNNNLATPLLAGNQSDIASSYVEPEDIEVDAIANNSEDDDEETNPLQSSLLLPTLSFGIGFLAALLGIGGGELIGPMLLMLGGNNNALDPTLTSAITALLSWLNSASNQVHNIALGRITSISYAILVSLVGFVGGLGGRSWVAARGSNNNKSSIIAFSLLAVLFIATMLLVWELATAHPEWEPKGMCHS